MFSTAILQRFYGVHVAYTTSGKTREKYMQRIDIEFKHDNLTKADLELIDSYYEHKRFQK